MGQKPLYYFVTADGAVAFASELKALKVLAKRLSFPLKIRISPYMIIFPLAFPNRGRFTMACIA